MKKKVCVETNSCRAWMLASRPKTLVGAAVPVMVGVAFAVLHGGGMVRMEAAVCCLLFALVMQIDANFVNDYFDFIKGRDDERRLGPRRACSQGWITAQRMRQALFLTTLLACLSGLPLVYYGGWVTLAIGAICVLFCFLYTTCLSSRGLGDVLVLVFFGLIPVYATYFLSLPAGNRPFSFEVLTAAMACGLVIDTLLLVNNYRDIDNDRRVGKRTLVVYLGPRLSRRLYLLVGYLACAMGLVFVLHGHLLAFLLPLFYLPLHTRTYRSMVRIDRGKALNGVLGDTARNLFVYGLLLVAGLLLESF